MSYAIYALRVWGRYVHPMHWSVEIRPRALINRTLELKPIYIPSL